MNHDDTKISFINELKLDTDKRIAEIVKNSRKQTYVHSFLEKMINKKNVVSTLTAIAIWFTRISPPQNDRLLELKNEYLFPSILPDSSNAKIK